MGGMLTSSFKRREDQASHSKEETGFEIKRSFLTCLGRTQNLLGEVSCHFTDEETEVSLCSRPPSTDLGLLCGYSGEFPGQAKLSMYRRQISGLEVNNEITPAEFSSDAIHL